MGCVSAERVVQGEVVGVPGKVPCTWQLVGLVVQEPWLAPGEPIPALAASMGLENATLTLQVAHEWQGVFANEWVWLRSSA